MNLPQLRQLPKSAKVLVGSYSLLVLFLLGLALFMVLAHNGIIGSYHAKNESVSATSGAAKETINVPDDDGGSAQIEVETVDIDGADSNVVKLDTGWFNYEAFKIAHAHHNGQTLVFFTLIFLLILSSVGETAKIVIGLGLGSSVILHTLGLAFRQYDIFEMILIAGGSLFSIFAFVICLIVLKDVASKSE